MNTQLVHRPARIQKKISTEAPIEIASIPMIRNTPDRSTAIQALMPVVASGGMVLMMVSRGNPIRMAVGGVMFILVLMLAITMFIRRKTGQRKDAEQQRSQFLDHLKNIESELKEEALEQQRSSLRRHPAPTALHSVIRDPHRLWERRRSDEDFMILRIGKGTGEFARGIKQKETHDPLQIPEPISQAHYDRMVMRTEKVKDLPIAIPARGVVSLVGSEVVTGEALRALILQVAALHAPDDLQLHLGLPLPHSAVENWALWLPHLLSDDQFDGPIGHRSVSNSKEDTAFLVDELKERGEEVSGRNSQYKSKLDRPHLCIIANMDTDHGRFLAASVAEVKHLEIARVTLITTTVAQHNEPGHVDVRVRFREDKSFSTEIIDRGEIQEPQKGEQGYPERVLLGGREGSLDDVSVKLTEAICRILSPLRLVEDAVPDAPLEQTIGLDSMLGIDDFQTYSVSKAWEPRLSEDFLNVPFAVDAAGQPMKLDIKESARSGMGPHGLCVGATGSGKSEVLRTLVLSQVICHPPEQLSLVLVDFKGGATFAGLEPLPHTAAIVDNLEDGKGLVDRLHDSILGEIQRRQRVLQRAGNLANVAEYNELRDAGKLEEPLPVLFVVIDEFGELLAAKPEFIDLFVQIGRIGRSIGMHLLLASQRLEEGRLRGLESYLSYRIGLRTFSAQESRSAIGTPDAHELPPIPGSGYLKVDPDIFERFKAAYVSGTYTAAAKASKRELPPIPMPLELANTTESWLLAKKEQFQNELSRQDAQRQLEAQKSGKIAATSQTTLNLIVSRLSPAAEKTRQIWLPPLPENLSLSEVLGRAELTSNRGLHSERDGLLRIPIGRKDRPLEQWQGPSTLDVSGSGGNVAIMGSPQSGKSNVLKTLISSAALTHTPEELSFYCIDMNGSSLNYLAGLPHVGDVTSRFDEDKMRRLIAEMDTFLRDREQLFSTHEISSVEQMRQMHAAGELPELFSADVFLAIDGWATLRKDFDDLAESVQSIAQRGLGFGIHVIFVTGRWADFRLPVQAVIGSRIELELNDALDSSIGRKPMQGLRGQPKGRSVTPDELFTQIALPEIHQPDVSQESSPIGLVRAIADAWQGQSAPQVRMLPESVNYAELLKNCGSIQPAIIGIDEATLNPVRFKLNTEQRHIMIVGDSASGKTNTLRVLIEEAIRGKKPGEVMFGVYDLKRSLLGQVPEEFLGEYAGIRSTAEVLTKGIAKELERRLPPANVTIDELRNKSWWTGPEIYIIVDDFELLEGSSNPLRPLVPYLSHAADIGLHLIIARRSAGFSRASYDAVLQGVRESGANGLLLSGEKQEGAIWPKIYLRPLPPGRAQWVNRQGRASMIQIATKIVK